MCTFIFEFETKPKNTVDELCKLSFKFKKICPFGNSHAIFTQNLYRENKTGFNIF